MTTSPTAPRWSSRVLRTILPADRRQTVLGLLQEGFHEHTASRGSVEAGRWYRAQATEHVWSAMRFSIVAVVLAFLTHGGLVVGPPWEAAAWTRWLWSAAPEVLLLLTSAHASWRARSWTAGLVVGALASCLVTLGAQLAFVAGLAIGQPSLFRLGLTWASLRDLADLFVSNSVTGFVIAAAGGLVGALGATWLGRK